MALIMMGGTNSRRMLFQVMCRVFLVRCLLDSVSHPLASTERDPNVRLLQRNLPACAVAYSPPRAAAASSLPTASSRHRVASSDMTSLPRCPSCGIPRQPAFRSPPAGAQTQSAVRELLFVHRPASLPGSRLARFSHSEGSNFRGGTQKFSPLPYARKTVGRVVGYLKHLRDQAGVTAETAEVTAIRQRVHRAYRAGYEFHQSAVRSSPELLAWVLRPDYWDYRLPRLKYPAKTKAVSDQESSAC
jgi:hypothetical protein